MLEHHDIERALGPVLKLIRAYEAEFLTIQAKTAAKALENETKRLAIENAGRAELNALTDAYRVKIDKATAKVTAGLIDVDLSEQLALFQKGFEAGIVHTAPVITEALQTSSTLLVARETAFVHELLSRTAVYGGRNLSSIVNNALHKKLSGRVLESVVRETATDIRDNGISIVYPSGRKVRDIEAYARMQMISSVSKASAENQLELYDSIDIDEEHKGYETSAHMGARPEHALWQGKVFYGWDNFVTKTDYGEVTGLCGVNCRHTFYPFIRGVSERRFSPYGIAENNRRYEDMQKQRFLERQIRQWKTQKNINEAMGLDVTAEKTKIAQYQQAMRELINNTGLTRQYAREQVAK